jgi:hypothetical protein
MISSGRHLHRVLTIGAALAALHLAPGAARAYDGFGWFGGFNFIPSPGQFLNEHANIRAAQGQQARPSHSPYAGNPNSYINKIRDPGFIPRYDVGHRRPPAYRSEVTASRVDPTAATQPAPTPPVARPVVPLASFFDAMLTLVWPSESPVEGKLKEKRDISDQACLVVLKETKQQKVATIGSVTTARNRLLDYGQPALQMIRAQSTPRIADSFHLFMLSLYESLAQAATPP